MKLIRFVQAASVVGVLSMAGTAAAADDVTLGTTGPDSTQTVTIENTSNVETTNTNNVNVVNLNVQQAKTGNVTVDKNTDVSGGAGSGNASNTATAATTVVINNAAAGSGSGGNGNGGGSGAGNPGGGGFGAGGGGVSAGSGAGSGGVLGAATTIGRGAGASILPVTGPNDPVDVSSLRSSFGLPTTAASEGQTKGAHALTSVMLVIAAALSLMGAVGSAIYARRQEEKVS